MGRCTYEGSTCGVEESDPGTTTSGRARTTIEQFPRGIDPGERDPQRGQQLCRIDQARKLGRRFVGTTAGGETFGVVVTLLALLPLDPVRLTLLAAGRDRVTQGRRTSLTLHMEHQGARPTSGRARLSRCPTSLSRGTLVSCMNVRVRTSWASVRCGGQDSAMQSTEERCR